MRELVGSLHDGRSSRADRARLRIYPDGTARVESEEGTASWPVRELEIPGRLGSTARRIGLPDGRVFETHDNDLVDAVLVEHGRAQGNWLHRIESRWLAVGAAVLVVLAAATIFVTRGVPAIAHGAAFAVEPELAAQIGSGTLAVLDRAFESTELSEERRAALTSRFDEVLAQAPEGYDYELLFRGGGAIGANAFALPSGTVVITDELIELAEHDDEIVSVLAHEVGHVVHRHGLRQVIQSSLFAIAVVLITGDLSSTSGFVAAVPAALAEASFSREFEREADDYAVDYLRRAKIARSHFAALLERMGEEHGDSEGAAEFLATHPSTRERVERLRER